MIIHYDQVGPIPKMKVWFICGNQSLNVIQQNNGIKEKNHIIISTDAGKSSEEKKNSPIPDKNS